MGESVSVIKHINEFNVVVNQLNLVEIDFTGEVHALILLFALPYS